MNAQQIDRMKQRYEELKGEWFRLQFPSDSAKMRELIRCERQLIAEGIIQPIWAN